MKLFKFKGKHYNIRGLRNVLRFAKEGDIIECVRTDFSVSEGGFYFDGNRDIPNPHKKGKLTKG